MIWTLSDRFDPECLPVVNRHYNRQTHDSPQFVPPGRCVVLKAPGAVWVTSWPFAEYTKHAWPGAWINSLFRKECEGAASDYIRDAVAATRSIWPDVPDIGIVSFIDPLHVKARKIRGRQAIGECYFRAGWQHVGYTKAGLWAMRLLPADMPAAAEPLRSQEYLSGCDRTDPEEKSTGEIIDGIIRSVLMSVTRETCLQAVREIAATGIPAQTAMTLVLNELEAK